MTHFPSPEDDSKLTMQGIHVDLTPALQANIRSKFSTLLLYDERIVRINVTLNKDQKIGHEHHFIASAQIQVSGPDVIAHASDKDAYVALGQLFDKLDHLLDRRHDKRKDKRNHPHGIDLPADLPKVDSPSGAL